MFVFTLPANIFEDIVRAIKNFGNTIVMFFTQLINTVIALFDIVGIVQAFLPNLSVYAPFLASFIVLFDIALIVGALRSII